MRSAMVRPWRARRLCVVLSFAGLAVAGAQSAVSADAAHGEELYSSRCGACHSLTDNGAGPRHAGLIGRKAGTQPGFDYSKALKKSKIVWDTSLLDKWLENPNALVPGNKMVVQLASDPKDRADIIAFLVAKAGSAQ
jgi:cytochrome c